MFLNLQRQVFIAMFDQTTLQEDIFDLSCKIARLKNILATDISEVTIFFIATDPLQQIKPTWITQQCVPFNLSGELRLLLEDSINEMERNVQSLRSLKK